jgi:transposase
MSTKAVPAPSDLPEDLATLKAMVAELLSALQNSQQRIAGLEHRLDQVLRRMYGQKSEKIDPAQRLLFLDNEASPATPPPDELASELLERETDTAPVRRHQGHGLPADLPRVRREHDLTAVEQLCPCCQTPRTKIGEDISEQLEYVPSSLFVIQHVRPKYACPKCRDGVVAAPKPEQPLAKGLPGPGLLAHVAVSKHLDHLPLNRQSRILERHGVSLSRSTLCDWMGGDRPAAGSPRGRDANQNPAERSDPDRRHSGGRVAARHEKERASRAAVGLPRRRDAAVRGVRLHARPPS